MKNKIKPLFLGSKLPKFTERLKYLTKALSILQTVCKTTETPVKQLSMWLKVRVLNKLLQLFSLYIKIKAYEAKLGLKFMLKTNPSLKLAFFFWNGTISTSHLMILPNRTQVLSVVIDTQVTISTTEAFALTHHFLPPVSKPLHSFPAERHQHQ